VYEEEHKISQVVDRVTQDRTIRAIYGHIVDMLNMDDQDYYIALVAPEESNFSVDIMSHYIPIDESTESLAANYGPPEDLIGLRVRVDYYGTAWRSGVAHIVPSRNRVPPGNTSEMPRRGFRFAIAGGGGI